MYKYIIFDFDGTIANSFPLVLRIANQLADTFGYEPLDAEDVERLRGKKPWDIVKDLKISYFKLPFMIARFKSEMYKQITFLKPFPHIENLLLELKKERCTIGIITSNSKENVTAFLDKYNLNFFDHIYTDGAIFGKGRILKNLIKDQEFDREQTLYVGDEVRDITTARDAGVKIVSVTWGYNTRPILEKQKPDFLINRPEELLALLKS